MIGKLILTKKEFHIEYMNENYHHNYSQWEILIDKIVSV